MLMFKYYLFLNYLYNNNCFLCEIFLKIFNKPYEFLINIIYGAYIPYNCSIDKSCNFLHGFYGIFISGNAIIGKNCIIYHQVTLGAGFPTTQKAPKIGNNIFIGAGAKLFGDITIDNDVKIGGAVITKSVKKGTVVCCNIRIK